MQVSGPGVGLDRGLTRAVQRDSRLPIRGTQHPSRGAQTCQRAETLTLLPPGLFAGGEGAERDLQQHPVAAGRPPDPHGFLWRVQGLLPEGGRFAPRWQLATRMASDLGAAGGGCASGRVFHMLRRVRRSGSSGACDSSSCAIATLGCSTPHKRILAASPTLPCLAGRLPPGRAATLCEVNRRLY